jgi:hypothetical protein
MPDATIAHTDTPPIAVRKSEPPTPKPGELPNRRGLNEQVVQQTLTPSDFAQEELATQCARLRPRH